MIHCCLLLCDLADCHRRVCDAATPFQFKWSLWEWDKGRSQNMKCVWEDEREHLRPPVSHSYCRLTSGSCSRSPVVFITSGLNRGGWALGLSGNQTHYSVTFPTTCFHLVPQMKSLGCPVHSAVGSPSSSHIVLFNAINRKFFQEGISRLRFNFFGRLRISVQTSREEAEVSESSLPALWWLSKFYKLLLSFLKQAIVQGESHVSLKLELWVENKNVCVSLTRLFNPSRAPQMNLMGHKMCQALFFALHWCIAPTVFVCTPPWN